MCHCVDHCSFHLIHSLKWVTTDVQHCQSFGRQLKQRKKQHSSRLPSVNGRRIWTHAIHFYRFPPYLDFDLHCRRKDWRQERWRGGIMLLIIGRCTLSCAPATDAASLAHLTAVGQVMKRNEVKLLLKHWHTHLWVNTSCAYLTMNQETIRWLFPFLDTWYTRHLQLFSHSNAHSHLTVL